MFKNSAEMMQERGKYVFPAIKFLPAVLEKGDGSYIIDVDGNRILDLNCGQFCNILGQSNLELAKTIAEQLEGLSHTSTACLSTKVFEAAELIDSICIGFNAQSLFLSTGSEAVEVALRYAKASRNRNGVICLSSGYHGLSLGSQSVTFGGAYARPIVEHSYSVPTPGSTIESDNHSLAIARDILLENRQHISAFILEPVLSVGGMVILSTYFLTGIRQLCDEFGVYLILDECQTGFGRTGKWFCCDKHKVVPDILVSAKGIGLGYPVSAVIFNADTFDISNIAISNYSSHQNDPFSASIIIAGVNYINKHNIIRRVNSMGDYFLKKLQEVEKAKTSIANSRGTGLMLAFDLDLDVSNYRQICADIMQSLLEHGVLIQATSQGKTFRILPDYLIEKGDVDMFIERLLSTLEKVGLR